jgi:uncharacterized membrane protein
MSFAREAAKKAAQSAVYDVAKLGLGAVWLAYAMPWLLGLGRDLGMTAGAAIAWAILAALILPFVVLFIFGWHRASKTPGNDAWTDGVPLEKIYNRRFHNETVVLDGRHFINPVFDNVTFFYQGTGPVFLENPTYVLHNGKMASRLASRNKVITMAMKIHDNLLKAGGVSTYVLNLGPNAGVSVTVLIGTVGRCRCLGSTIRC